MFRSTATNGRGPLPMPTINQPSHQSTHNSPNQSITIPIGGPQTNSRSTPNGLSTSHPVRQSQHSLMPVINQSNARSTNQSSTSQSNSPMLRSSITQSNGHSPMLRPARHRHHVMEISDQSAKSTSHDHVVDESAEHDQLLGNGRRNNQSNQSIKQSNNQSNNQSVYRKFHQSIKRSFSKSGCQTVTRTPLTMGLSLVFALTLIIAGITVSHVIDQSNRQSAVIYASDQLINQSLNQANKQTIKHSIDDITLWTYLPRIRSTNQSNDQSIAQSIKQSLHAIYSWQLIKPNIFVFASDARQCEVITQSFNQPIRQSNDQSNNQTINHSIKQSINCHVVDQCYEPLFGLPNTRCMFQSIDQTTDQIINQSIDLSADQDDQSIHQSINGPSHQYLVYVHSTTVIFNDFFTTLLKMIDLFNQQTNHPSGPVSDFIDPRFIMTGKSRLIDYQSIYQSSDQSVSQPLDQSINQSMDQLKVWHTELLKFMHYEDDDQSINQAVNQPVSQALNYIAYHRDAIISTEIDDQLFSIDQSNKQSNKASSDQSNDQSTNQPINPSVEHWTQILLAGLLVRNHCPIIDSSQSVNPVKLIDQSIKPPVRQAYKQPVKESKSETNDQSINQSIDQMFGQINSFVQRFAYRQTKQIDLTKIASINQSLNQTINQLGSLKNCHYKIKRSTDQSIKLSINQSINLSLNLIRSSNKNNQIIVVLVNHSFLSLAINWICRYQAIKQSYSDHSVDQSINQSANQAKRRWLIDQSVAHAIDQSNYLFVAEDRVSFRVLKKLGVNVLSINQSIKQSIDQSIEQSIKQSNSDADDSVKLSIKQSIKQSIYQKKYSQSSYQETLFVRSVLINQAVNQGFNLIFTHLDTVWFDDLWINQLINQPIDRSNNQTIKQSSDQCDIHVSLLPGMTGVKAGGGIFSINQGSPQSIKFANDLMQCEFENLDFLIKNGKNRFYFSDDPDIDCLELISQRAARRDGLKRCVFDPAMFVTQREFFEQRVPQKKSIWPHVVHLDQSIDQSIKQSLKQSDVDFIGEAAVKQSLEESMKHSNDLSNKTRLMVDWDLWMVDDARMAMSIDQSMNQLISRARIQCIQPQRTVQSEYQEIDQSTNQQPLNIQSTDQLSDSDSQLTSEVVPQSTHYSVHPRRYIVNILADTDWWGLNETLSSLAKTNYQSIDPSNDPANIAPENSNKLQVPIDIHIAIQQPIDQSFDQSADQSKVIDIATHFKWRLGRKKIIYLENHVGVTDQWINHWTITQAVPQSETQSKDQSNDNHHHHGDDSHDHSSKLLINENVYQLALTSGMIVSREWFVWSDQTINQLHHSAQHIDQLMGIHLGHTVKILGETPSQRYGTHQPINYLSGKKSLDQSGDQSLFFYQYTPFLGTIFFPQHFLSFLQWYQSIDQSITESACVSTLVSNKWWTQSVEQSNDRSVNQSVKRMIYWEQWLVRFMFESGWFSLHTNWRTNPNNIQQDNQAAKQSVKLSEPRALLVDSSPTSTDVHVLLIKRLKDSEKEAITQVADQTPLFDLHFRRFPGDFKLLALRSQYYPPISRAVKESDESHDHHHAHHHDHHHAELLEEQRLKAKVEIEDLTLNEQSVNHALDHDLGVWAAVEQLESSNSLVRVGDHHQGDESLHESIHQSIDPSVHHSIDESIQQSISDEERGVTATSLIIDMMVAQMQQEDNDQSNQQSFDLSTDQSSDQLVRLKQKVDAAMLGLAHRHQSNDPSIDRANNQFQCFTMDQLSDEAVSIDPRIYQSINQSIKYDLRDWYATQYMRTMGALDEVFDRSVKQREMLTQSSAQANNQSIDQSVNKPFTSYVPPEIRFFVYRPKQIISFDGHLRGIFFAFLAALMSDRVLLIDLPDFHILYDTPWGRHSEGRHIEWDYRIFADKYFVNNHDIVFSEGEIDTKTMNDRLRVEDLNAIYGANLLYHVNGVTFDRLLFLNTLYAPHVTTLFGSKSRMRRTGETMHWLLSAPRISLVAEAKALMTTLDWHKYQYHIGIHVANKKVSEEHMNCLRSLLSTASLIKESTSILLTGQGSQQAIDQSGQSLLRTMLERFGTVYTDARLFDSTLSMQGQGNATISATPSIRSNNRTNDQDLHMDPYFVHQFLYGEYDLTIGSGTTYEIFGAARTGYHHQAFLFKGGVKDKDGVVGPDYCGPLHRIDQHKENDISF